MRQEPQDSEKRRSEAEGSHVRVLYLQHGWKWEEMLALSSYHNSMWQKTLLNLYTACYTWDKSQSRRPHASVQRIWTRFCTIAKQRVLSWRIWIKRNQFSAETRVTCNTCRPYSVLSTRLYERESYCRCPMSSKLIKQASTSWAGASG